MVYIKSNSLKLVFFLFCLSQVQAGTKLLPDKSDNPFDELFRELTRSAGKISDKLHLRLSEADVNVDKYIDTIKENAELTGAHLRETIEKLEESIDKVSKQICDAVQHQINRVTEELKSRDPEIGEKIKKLKAELSDLVQDILKLFEEIKKPAIERFNELKDEFRVKTKPVVKRWIPIIKDVEEIILALIPDKKKEIKKN